MIAIENTQPSNALQTRNRNLTEALEQQTATSEILRVIKQLADGSPAGVGCDCRWRLGIEIVTGSALGLLVYD